MLARPRRAHLAAAAMALYVLAAPALADEFSEFRIPKHSAFSWTGSFSGNADRRTQDLTPDRIRFGAIRGAGRTELLRWVDADDGFWSFDAGFDLDGDRNREERTRIISSLATAQRLDSRSSARGAEERWRVGGTRSFYPGRLPWFVRGDLGVIGSQMYRWSRLRTTDLVIGSASTSDEWTESHDRLRLVQTDAHASVGAGIGRVRDASSVYLARVLEHRLRERGALTRELSHDARQRLVNLLAVSDGLDDVRSRPAKQVWSEVARILVEDGALPATGLDPAAVQRAGESLLDRMDRGPSPSGLPRPVVIRSTGRSVGVLVSGRHERSSYFSSAGYRSQLTVDGVPGPVFSFESSSSSAGSSDAVDLGVTAEWHRPVGLRLQLDAQTFAAVPVRRQDDGSVWVSDAAATWLLADRWWLRGRVGHWRRVTQLAESGETQTDDWQFACNLDIAYEIEDRTTLHLSVHDGQQRTYVPTGSSTGERAYTRQQEVFLGLAYRFAGRFSAPGFPSISEPLRATPGP